MFNIFPNEHIILCICLAKLPTIKNSPIVLGNLEINVKVSAGSVSSKVLFIALGRADCADIKNKHEKTHESR